MRSKKAQITIFIIIGIVILFSVAIFAYLRSEGIGRIDILQSKSPPVVAFVEACLDKTATEAIQFMGDQGGYITVPPPIALNPTRFVSLVPGLGGDTAPKVPYWYYEGEVQIPSIEYMQVQAEEYINQNLGRCINNYTGLREEFDIIEHSDYSADVTFAEQDTLVKLAYDLEVRPRGSQEIIEREEFVVKVDAKVRKMWDLANAIFENENQEAFFEKMTMNIMAAHPPEDIPFTGMEFDCRPRRWLLSDIKETINEALPWSVVATRFEHTDHDPFEASEDDYENVHQAVEVWRESEVFRPLVLPKNIPSDSYDYFQHYFRFDSEQEYEDFKAIAQYKPEWGMKLLATPNEYGVLKSSDKNFKSRLMSFFLCMNAYHFVYDLIYPVMINIHDEEAFHKKGFTFRYAFPVQIYHNAPDRTLQSTRIIEPTEYSTEFCGNQGGEEHIVIAKDPWNNEISKVNISFRCLTQQCSLGITKTNNRHLQWTGNFPAGCSGPMIIAEKEGYLRAEKQYTGTDPLFIEMHPVKQVPFEVKRLIGPGNVWVMDPDTYAIVQLENSELSMNSFDFYSKEDLFNTSKTIDLLIEDATYDVNIMLIKKVQDEEQLVGGWIGEWTVNGVDVLDAEKVIFTVPQKAPPPSTDEDFYALWEMMSNRTLNPEAMPEIVRSDEYSGDEQ